MYTMTVDGKPPFDPRLEEYSLEATPVLEREENRIATLEFAIWPNNPRYGEILLRQSVIDVYDEGELMIRMRAIRVKRTMDGGKEYECEELLGAMNDTIHRPNAFGDNQSAAQRFLEILGDYNARQPNPLLRVTAGTVDYSDMQAGPAAQAPDEIDPAENYAVRGFGKSHWALLKDNTVDRLGGYLIPHYSAAGITLDYLSEPHIGTCEETIEFGKNLAELFVTSDAGALWTRLIPLGADRGTSSPYRRAGGANKEPLDISGATNKPVPGQQDYIDDAAGVALYGVIEHTERWEEIKTANELYTRAAGFMEGRSAAAADTVTLTWYDLRGAGADAGKIHFMQRVFVKSEPHGISRYYLVKKERLPLGEPEGLEFTCGDPKETLTDITKRSESRAKNGYEDLDDRVFLLEE
ncbi:MAG: hypothetical protein IKE30_07945 [Clostridia bacterium]|nr:hypothetical protein [Clostridia bacterium]